MAAINEISVEEARLLLHAHQAIAVDVREVEEFSAGHISNVVLNPLSEFDITKIPNDGIVIIVCRSGQRSGRVCEALLETHPHLHNLLGGMKAWAEAGLDMESTYETPLVL